MSVTLSAAFPPGMATPDHIALAERLGYERAWVYDSPALYHDVWMTLARAAERTDSIGLGPAVLVPSLRHPMVNAAAIATLADLAPGRVVVAIGSGFTGRHVLGQRPMRWADVRAHVATIRALLRGEEAEWDGKPIRMIHPAGYGPSRPIEVPILVGADGPKGGAAAAELGDGAISAAVVSEHATNDWRALLTFGTVLDEGEEPTSPAVVERVGPVTVPIFHALYERAGADGVDAMPGGQAWREALEREPERTRHLAVHEGHMVELTDRDQAGLDAGLASMIGAFTLTAPAGEIPARLDALASQGVTEVLYQPCGPDITRELTAFAEAGSLKPRT